MYFWHRLTDYWSTSGANVAVANILKSLHYFWFNSYQRPKSSLLPLLPHLTDSTPQITFARRDFFQESSRAWPRALAPAVPAVFLPPGCLSHAYLSRDYYAKPRRKATLFVANESVLMLMYADGFVGENDVNDIARNGKEEGILRCGNDGAFCGFCRNIGLVVDFSYDAVHVSRIFFSKWIELAVFLYFCPLISSIFKTKWFSLKR